MKRVLIAAAMMLSLAAEGAAHAQACWQTDSVEAAQIHEFDVMLMVAALRCQLKGVDFVPDYNRFVTTNRPVLVEANDALRRHYNPGMGGRAALDAYDRMTTATANKYGNGGGVSEDCETLRAIVVAATPTADTSERSFVLAHAQRQGMDPALDGSRCGMTIAEAQPIRLPVLATGPEPVQMASAR